jgi:hypothetical protein
MPKMKRQVDTALWAASICNSIQYSINDHQSMHSAYNTYFYSPACFSFIINHNQGDPKLQFPW